MEKPVIPDAFTLLDLWDWGQAQPPVMRALSLLEASYPAEDIQTLFELSMGQRDARLLFLQQALFGPNLTSVAVCPTCGEKVELSFGVDQIRAGEPDRSDKEEVIDQAGIKIRFRLPNSMDLVALLGAKPEEARQRLLERCIIRVSPQEVEQSFISDYEIGKPLPFERFPPGLIEALLARMAQSDPQAQINLAVKCPACQHDWQIVFDILTYFWRELGAWTDRLLDEVHVLASVYHWQETDILKLSPQRRQAYLERIDW